MNMQNQSTTKFCPICRTALIVEPNSPVGPPGLRVACPACSFAYDAVIIEPHTPHIGADGSALTLEDIEAEAVKYWRGQGAPA